MRNLYLFLVFILSGLFVNAQTTYYNFEQALVDDNVRSLEEDLSGNVWIGTIGGITKFDGTTFTSYTTDDGLGGNIVYDILAHSSGDIYAATSGGMSVFDGTSWVNYTLGDGLPSTIIWSVEEDNLNQVWVGGSENGVSYFDGTNWYPLGVDDGLAANGVKVIFADRNDNIWFGTGNGVSMYDGSEFLNFDNSTGLPGLLVNDIIQLYNGNIALATNGGVGVYNFHSWTSITTVEGLPAANILSIKEDYNQNLWMGTSVGLVKYDWTTFTTWNYDDGLSNTIVSKLLLTHAGDNKIWAASPFNGLTVFDNNETFIIYRTNRDLVSDTVQTIYVDDENIVWVGTDLGVNRVDDLHWRTYSSADGLTSNDITCFHKDINGNIWVGTADGLNIIDGENITTYTTSDGLTSNIINGITSDDLGVVYIATPNMVTVIDGGVVTDTLDVTDGLLSDNITQIRFENGRLWVLTDAAIQFYDGIWNDATLSGCATTPANTKAKCLNSSVAQYFGTDQTLRSYQDGLTTPLCFAHPYPGTSVIESLVESPLGMLCSFDNGDMQLYNVGPTWTPFPMPYNVSFVADQGNNYAWIGFESNGLGKLCYNLSETISYTDVTPSCHDVDDASLDIIAPVGAYTYSIDNGSNWQAGTSFNSLSSGYHHVLVQNAGLQIVADSVIFIDSYDIIDDANITITQMLCNGDNNGSIELEYSNPGSHIWENLNTTLYLRDNLIAGIYSVTISDGAFCTRVLENEMVQPDLLDYLIDYTDINCFGDTDGSISLDVSGGTIPYSYSWSSGDEEADIVDLVEDDYSFTITDANACETSGMQTIDAPTVIEITGTPQDIDCFGYLTGEIDITVTGGVLDYVIEWNDPAYVDGNNDIVNAPAGDYSVTVTDDHLCTATLDFTIDQPDGIEIISEDITNVLCYADSTGEVFLDVQGGAGDLSYEWVHEGEIGIYAITDDIADLPAGIYHLTITDENLCEITEDYEITESPELEVTLDVTPISCGGYEDGEILANASGGSGTYSAYIWYDIDVNIVGVAPHITGLGAGYYEVVVRDSYYCYDTAFTTLTQAVPHVYAITPSSMSCNGLADGQIEVTVDGSSGVGFTFDWQDAVAGNINIADNLSAGEYYVTITDPTDCVEILSAVVEEPYMDDIGEFNDVEYLCYGNNLELNPGTFSDYIWSTGSEDPTITVENEDVYFVEVVDAGGCHLGDTVQVIISTVYNNESINLVSVTDDNNIKVYWERTPGEGTELFKIYKDSGDGFEYLSSKLYNEISIFEDTDVDPINEYYSYQITAVDSCGSESDYSDTHRSCLVDVVPDGNGACWLDWGEYEGFFVVYYFIMRGTSPDNLVVVDSTLYNDFNWVEMNPNPDGSYYRIKVRRIDGCSPGDGEYYDEAYSNIVFCDNYVGFVNSAVINTSVYPNPFSDQLTIGIDLNIPGELTYSFINILGQEIIEPISVNVEKGKHDIAINPDIAPGIYVMRLEFEGEVYNIRLIRE